MATTHDTAAFDRAVNPVIGFFTREQAEALVGYRGNDSLRNRIDDLAERNTEGKRYTELVQRALTHLSVGTSTVTRLPEGDGLAECAASAMATEVLHAWPQEMLERDLELAREYGARLEEA